MATRYCGGISFLEGFYHDVDRLRIEIELTSLYDIFFKHHNDVLAITQRKVKLHIIVIPIFNVVLISDKYENVITNGKHVVLFHLLKHSDKLSGNIVYKIQIKMGHFIQVTASLAFAVIY